jgi:hypothetical protein
VQDILLESPQSERLLCLPFDRHYLQPSLGLGYGDAGTGYPPGAFPHSGQCEDTAGENPPDTRLAARVRSYMRQGSETCRTYQGIAVMLTSCELSSKSFESSGTVERNS